VGFLLIGMVASILAMVIHAMIISMPIPLRIFATGIPDKILEI
jgi:hypothetical protein